MKIHKLFNKPKIIGMIGDVNTGKTNTINWIIRSLKNKYDFTLYSYGIKTETQNIINSIEELEKIKNSVIFIDEFFNLFDLDNRKIKTQIEKTLRLINHPTNNNIIVLCGLPENFKKFISAKINVYLYKSVTVDDFINGSRVKKVITNYCGSEMGSVVLRLDINQLLVYDGNKYNTYKVPYIKKGDTKLKNKPILQTKAL